MMRYRPVKYILLFLLSAVSAFSAFADDNPRRIISEWTLSLGRLDAMSTYLSPLNYHGFRPELRGSWSKGMPFAPEEWRMRFDAGIGGGRLLNTPGSAIEYSVGADFSWGMEHVWKKGERFTFSGGANVGFDAEALWLTRNSNNPVSLPMWAGVGLTGEASCSFRIGRLPVALSERVAIPTLGAFFMPGYGESFYEIYVGNHSGLVHCGWWGNAPGISSDLRFTMRFRGASLSVGYRLDLRQLHANHLRTRLATNALTLTLVK